MVKFTFASAALIVASLSAFASALPTTFSLYNITSIQTGYLVFSDGNEASGSDVSTIQASQGAPGTTTLEIYQYGDAIPNTYGIRGKAGLYVSVQQESTGTHLTWDTHPYEWLITSSDPDSDFGSYNNYTINIAGHDLFWYDTNDQSTFIAIQAEASKTASQLSWQIQTVEVQ